MQEFTLHQELELPLPPQDIFPFFADARNLETITPAWLRFEIVTPGPIQMQVGTRIDYRLRIRGVPVRWQSEITAWNPPDRFIDEQRAGPYRLWIHEHQFHPTAEGTLCVDHVRYAVFGGRLVNEFLVRRDLEKIFAFRRETLLRRFGAA